MTEFLKKSCEKPQNGNTEPISGSALSHFRLIRVKQKRIVCLVIAC